MDVYFEAFDDNTGVELDPEKVKLARREEVEYVRSMKLSPKYL